MKIKTLYMIIMATHIFACSSECKEMGVAAVEAADFAVTKHMAVIQNLTAMLGTSGVKVSEGLLKESAKALAGGATEVSTILADGTIETVKVLADGTVQTARVLTDGSVEIAKILADGTVETAKVLAPTAEEVTRIAGSSVVDASAKIGVESVKELAAVGQAAVFVLGVGVVIYGVTQLYPIAQDMKACVYPSEVQKTLQDVTLEQAKQKLELLKTESAFRHCLINNRHNPKREISGLPSVCQAAADSLALFGKYNEVDQATAYFKKTGNKYV